MLDLFGRHKVKLAKKEHDLDNMNNLVSDYNAGAEVAKLVVVM
jgi:hypothetical protein